MEKTIYTKLLEAQKEIGAIKKDSDNPFFHSKYFDINAILNAVKPILNKHGLIIVQGLSSIGGLLALSTKIISEDGTFIESECPIMQMSDPQKQGSAITYFRRYALQSLLALEAEDDDGNSASQKKPKSKNDDTFFAEIQPTDEEVIIWIEKLESAKDLKELKKFAETVPGLVKDKIGKIKFEQIKNKLKPSKVDFGTDDDSNNPANPAFGIR